MSDNDFADNGYGSGIGGIQGNGHGGAPIYGRGNGNGYGNEEGSNDD